MSDQLKALQAEFSENRVVLDRTRQALSRASQELDKLLKTIYTLTPEDVPDFVTKRRELEDYGEIYARIVNFRAGRCDEIQRAIMQETIIENRQVDEKTARLEAISQRLPFLPLTSPERADLQAELAELQRS